MENKGGIELFCAYSHEDEQLRNELEKHLASLKRQGVIRLWHDRRIAPGAEWEKEIDKHISKADIILLLISSDFIHSDYCCDKEVAAAMQRHESGSAVVIPIILRLVDWKGMPFAKLQALPTGAKPVTTWTDQDAAFLNIVEGIKGALDRLSKRRNVLDQLSDYPPDHIPIELGSRKRIAHTGKELYATKTDVSEVVAVHANDGTGDQTYTCRAPDGRLFITNERSMVPWAIRPPSRKLSPNERMLVEPFKATILAELKGGLVADATWMQTRCTPYNEASFCQAVMELHREGQIEFWSVNEEKKVTGDLSTISLRLKRDSSL